MLWWVYSYAIPIESIHFFSCNNIFTAEYGWVQDISEDRQYALPQADIAVTEGDFVALSIYFLQNGPSNTDSYLFSITTRGTAIGIK